jgi:hypothetical protein
MLGITILLDREPRQIRLIVKMDIVCRKLAQLAGNYIEWIPTDHLATLGYWIGRGGVVDRVQWRLKPRNIPPFSINIYLFSNIPAITGSFLSFSAHDLARILPAARPAKLGLCK